MTTEYLWLQTDYIVKFCYENKSKMTFYCIEPLDICIITTTSQNILPHEMYSLEGGGVP